MIKKYLVFEFKSEDRYFFIFKRSARRFFNKIKKVNVPGIWQLYKKNQIIDEFVGGLNG